MPTQITKQDLADDRRTVFRVEGEMLREDAELIARLARETIEEGRESVVIDLADLDFMDSDAASVLRGLQQGGGVEIEGVEIFLQASVDLAERV